MTSIQTIENRTQVDTWHVAPQDTPYAISWQGARGNLYTGRVIGVTGDCYEVEVITHKATYSPRTLSVVRMVDASPAIGGAACWLDVDALLDLRWDDGSEREDLADRLVDMYFWSRGFASYRYA
jgi:hypothetical protein